eukprot:4770024-Pyramimonas_sp.AAC.1
MQWAKRPHRPVLLSIVDNGYSIRHFVYTVSPSLPSAPVIGPTAAPADWSTHRALAEACLAMATDEAQSVEAVW